MAQLKDKRLFLLDMDGTIYLDEQLFDGTLDFLDYVKAMGGRAMYLTNNSSKSVKSYVDKLKRLGISACEADFLTSVNATVLHLQREGYRKIYAFGTRSFQSQLRENGLTVTDKLEEDIDCLCCGFDTELTFQKLEDACILLNRGVAFVATNPDWVCPTWYGSVPDCGSVCGMIYNATGKKPIVIGKPSALMPELAMDKLGIAKEETCVVGDRIYTDVKSGLNAGCVGILVMSGETTYEILEQSPEKPHLVMESAREILDILKTL